MHCKIMVWIGLSGWLLGAAGAAHSQQHRAYFLTAEAEKTIGERVLAAVQNEGAGASTYVYRKRPLTLSADEIYRQIVQRNPTILAQHQDRVSAQQLRLQSQAAFDPILDFAAAYTRTDFFARSDVIVRQRPTRVLAGGITPDGSGDVTDQVGIASTPGGQTTGEESQPIAVTDSFGNLVCVSVDGELVNPGQCALRTEARSAREFASAAADALDAWSFNAAAEKLFSWGTRLGIEFESNHRSKNFFPLDDFGILQPLSLDDPIGRGSAFPWTSAFIATLDAALPFSKDFGPFGSVANVGVLLAKVGERQAGWALASAINSTLLNADDAYWELVRSLLQLEIIAHQIEVLSARAERAERLYESRQITTYDRAQVKAELANVESEQQFAWAAVVRSSNRLAELLDYPPEVLLLPQRYVSALRQTVVVNPQAAIATARAASPQLMVSRLGLQSSRILLKNARVQTRPDLFLSFRVALSQDDRVLGYESFEDSFSSVFSPDVSDYFVGVSFRVPFGNRAVKSRLAQARLQRDQARDDVQQTELAVIQEINTVTAAINSTRAQIAASAASLQHAEVAYEKARELRDQGLIAEFELLQKLSDLLLSRAVYIDALIEHRKTNARLLAAQGMLASQYVKSASHAAP